MMAVKGNMSPWRGSVKCKEAAVAVGRETGAGGAPLKTGGLYGATPGERPENLGAFRKILRRISGFPFS
jgi:hypothetical protein